jgi:hypothetical protein
MQSKARTVNEYLAELPPDRRAAIQAVREVILANLDQDYEEGMQYGMIGYYVPHRVFPAGYHCDPSKPLPFASLASQKNHMSLGLMSNYGGGEQEQWFRSAWAKTGKKLDMGACCVRFKKLDDLPLDVIGEAVRRVPAKAFVRFYEKAILTMNKGAAAKRAAKPAPGKSASAKAAARKPAAKKAARPAKARAGRT